MRVTICWVFALGLMGCSADRGGLLESSPMDAGVLDLSVDAATDVNTGDGMVDLGADVPLDTPPDEFVPDPDSLRGTVTNGFLIGAAVHQPYFDDTEYKDTVRDEFNFITPELFMKWNRMEPTQGTTDYSKMDALVASALADGQTVRGHPLIWRDENPAWLDDLSANALVDAMKKRITDLMERYRGKIQIWDVVASAVTDEGSVGGHPLFANNNISTAFRTAKSVDPDATLLYNAKNIYRASIKSKGTADLIAKLKADGVPIDGIGIELHLRGSDFLYDFTEKNLRDVVDVYARMGLEVHFSGLDVTLNDLRLTDVQKQEVQSRVYQTVAAVCSTEPMCKSVTVWGVTDKHSWLAPNEFPLPFDINYDRKLSYRGLRAGVLGMITNFTGIFETTCPEPGSVLFCDPFVSNERRTRQLVIADTPASHNILEFVAPQGDVMWARLRSGIGLELADGIWQQEKANASIRFGDTFTSGELHIRAQVFLPSSLQDTAGMNLISVAENTPPWGTIALTLENDARLSSFSTVANQQGQTTGPLPRDTWICIGMAITVGDNGGTTVYTKELMTQSLTNTDTLPNTGIGQAFFGVNYKAENTPEANVYMDDVTFSRTPLPCN